MTNYLKIIIIVFIIPFVFLLSNEKELHADTEKQENKLTWNITLEEAVILAQKDNKPIFVDFTGSDWCGWCFRLDDEVFSQPEFIEYAQNNLVLLKIDFPRDKPQSEEIKKYNRSLLERFGVQGFPTIILLDKDGNLINKTGYQAGGAQKYIEHLKKIIG